MKKIVILSGSLYVITAVSLYFGYHNQLDRDLMIFYTSVLFLAATICALAVTFLVRPFKTAAKVRKHAQRSTTGKPKIPLWESNK